MTPNDWEYDPEYQEAYQQTVDYQMQRLSHAIADTGNEIARGLLPHLIASSSIVRAAWSEYHAEQVGRMGRVHRWWHVVTGHWR